MMKSFEINAPFIPKMGILDPDWLFNLRNCFNDYFVNY